jgi:predicted transcriptional regulator
MINGGKHLNELLKERGFKLGAVAKAIGVNRVTIGAWTDNAPIGKLIRLSDFTGIPILDVIDCFRPDRESIDTNPDQIDRTGGDEN